MKVSLKTRILSYVKEEPRTEAHINYTMRNVHKYSDKYICDTIRIMLDKDKTISRDKRKNANNRMVFHYYPTPVLKSFSIPGTRHKITVGAKSTLTQEKINELSAEFTQNPQSATESPEFMPKSNFEILKGRIVDYIASLNGGSAYSSGIRDAVGFVNPFDKAIESLVYEGKIKLCRNSAAYELVPQPNELTVHSLIGKMLVGHKVFFLHKGQMISRTVTHAYDKSVRVEVLPTVLRLLNLNEIYLDSKAEVKIV